MLDLFGEGPVQRKVLRAHQVDCIAQVRKSMKDGSRRTMVQMPTGGGKTITAARIIEGALSKGKRVIFTVPMITLIDQTVAEFEAEGIRGIGVMQANHPRTDPLARVQVASVKTLCRRMIPDAALVIVDEAHVRDKTVERLMVERPDAYFIGLTATPWAKGLGLVWQDLVIPCTIGSLIEGGFLSQFTVYAPDVPDLSRVKVERGDYADAQLAEVMGDAQLVGNVVATWLTKGENRPTLVFGVDRAHAKQLHVEFERSGVASAYVDGETDSVERGSIGRRFRSGEIRVICSVRTMTTGVDLPVSCICDCAPTRSHSLHVQKIGRGLRVNPGTEDLIVLDHAGNSLRLGLVTDIHRDRLDTSKPAEKAKPEAAPEKLPKPCSKCGALHTARICPACGHERKPVSSVESAEGELVEITGAKPKAVSMAVKEQRFAGLLWIARERGYKPGWAFHKYREWHGVAPANGMTPTPVPPSVEVGNYVLASQIRWSKSQQKRGAA